MLDECIGHMTEKVVIPPADEIEIKERRFTKLPPSEYLPYRAGDDLVPDMIKAGDGYRIHTTGLTHDERGYPVMSADCQDKLVRRLVDKIRKSAKDIVHIEEEGLEDAEVVVVSYGITSRVARLSIDMARKRGIKVGMLRLLIVWPFPEHIIRDLAPKIKGFVVPEINYGQLVLEVERCAGGKAKTIPVSHMGGSVHDPATIEEAIVEAAR
jgi:2-oxoglutarate ferredoxin oxidoreductase subunit alpha